jgi:hypothetical protein
MEVLFILLLMAILAASNVLCFMIGARVGQKVDKGEEVKISGPMEAIKEHKAEKEFKREMSRVETIMQNIDSYDGYGYGQREVPRG